MGRVKNWLTQLQDVYKDAEAPPQFFYWAGVAVLSVVARKNVWLNRAGLYRTFPNLYIMLLAKSGEKKSLPILVAKRLTTAADCTRVVSGRNSIQMILSDLSKVKAFAGRPPMTEAHALLISGEFNNLVIKDELALPLLTELYNTYENEPDWKNSLKQTGVETLKNPCITMLGATNPAHIKDYVSQRDTEGGFIGRTMLVTPREFGKINAATKQTGEEIDLGPLINRLKEIAAVTGQFQWQDEKTRLLFDTWYEEHELKKRAGKFNDPTGTVNRTPENVVKLAMLLSLAESDDKTLHSWNIEESIDSCLQFIETAAKTASAGGYPLARALQLVLNQLVDAPEYKMVRSRLLRNLSGDLGAEELDKIIRTLEESKSIEEPVKEGGGFCLQIISVNSKASNGSTG